MNSVILLRGDAPARPDLQAELIARILLSVADELARGCVVSATKDRVRLRLLPFS